MNIKEIIKQKLDKIREKINYKDKNEEYKQSMISINKHFHKREYDEVDKILDKLNYSLDKKDIVNRGDCTGDAVEASAANPASF